MSATVTAPGWSVVDGDSGQLQLVGQRCIDCEYLVFPPTAEICPSCWSERIEPENVDARGTLYSFTIVRRSFPGREVPYVIGQVDLDSGLRVMARVVSDDLEALHVGQKVAGARSANDREGQPATTYEFQPID